MALFSFMNHKYNKRTCAKEVVDSVGYEVLDRERKLELMIASFAPLDVFSSKKEKRQKEKKNRPFTRTSHDINLNTMFL